MLSWIKSMLRVPQPSGPSRVLRRLDPAVVPITRDGVTQDGEAWRITSTEKRTVRLYELPIANVDMCMLAYRVSMRTENAKGIYLQMWCRFAGRGEFFSKGLNDKVRGTNEWSSHEVPFLLRKNQTPDLLKLELVFEGPGTCWVRDVEIVVTPLA